MTKFSARSLFEKNLINFMPEFLTMGECVSTTSRPEQDSIRSSGLKLISCSLL